MKVGEVTEEDAWRAVTECRALLGRISEVHAEQIKDEGLWFEAKTAPEAYLQAALKRLHETME